MGVVACLRHGQRSSFPHGGGDSWRQTVFSAVVASALFVVIFGALGVWQVRGQVEYLRAYARKTGKRISIDDQAQAYVRNPLRGWVTSNAATWRGMKVTAQAQGDAELERYRRAYLFRRRIWLTCSAVSIVALGFYLNVVNR
jgi:hypothetical protein